MTHCVRCRADAVGLLGCRGEQIEIACGAKDTVTKITA